jgi:hypothetical protein
MVYNFEEYLQHINEGFKENAKKALNAIWANIDIASNVALKKEEKWLKDFCVKNTRPIVDAELNWKSTGEGYFELCEYGFVVNANDIVENSNIETNRQDIVNVLMHSNNWKQLGNSDYFAFLPGYQALRNAGIDIDSVSDDDIVKEIDAVYHLENGRKK